MSDVTTINIDGDVTTLIRVQENDTTIVKIGAIGPRGPAGTILLVTNGPPSSLLGVNGQFAIDPTAQLIYGPKTAGVWGTGLSYRGLDGAPGLDATAIYGPKGLAGGVASLDGGGKVPTSQLPALNLGETFSVASQAAMLALAANPGDVAIRTDLIPQAEFLLLAAPASNLANWV
jgi:hypothetical protein